jgi:hypothetical protein
MTTGKMFFITASGFDKPMEEIPTEDFAVAKAEPRLQKTNAQVTPMKPKNYIVVIVEGIVKRNRNMDGEGGGGRR